MRPAVLLSLFCLNALVLASLPADNEGAGILDVEQCRSTWQERNHNREYFCEPGQIPTYSSVVVFGASYSDNAQARPAQYDSTLKTPPYFKGRSCNGIVFNKYTAKSLGAKLINYAYAGAQSNRLLTSGSVPSSRGQLKQYIADIEAGRIDRGDKLVLHILWMGAYQSMKSIVYDALTQGAMDGNTTAGLVAEIRVDQQIVEVTDQVRIVRNSSAVQHLPSNYILLPVPPFELIPDIVAIATSSAGDDTALLAKTIGFLKKISDRYNQALISWAQLKGSPSINGYDKSAYGWVQTFDIPGLWKDMFRNPEKFNFVATSKPCLDSDGEICAVPDQYIQWDLLHPTTKVQQIVGDECTKLALQCH